MNQARRHRLRQEVKYSFCRHKAMRAVRDVALVGNVYCVSVGHNAGVAVAEQVVAVEDYRLWRLPSIWRVSSDGLSAITVFAPTAMAQL